MKAKEVVVLLAQPSSRLYQRLDKLLLLSEGHTMYYGAKELSAFSFHARLRGFARRRAQYACMTGVFLQLLQMAFKHANIFVHLSVPVRCNFCVEVACLARISFGLGEPDVNLLDA